MTREQKENIKEAAAILARLMTEAEIAVQAAV